MAHPQVVWANWHQFLVGETIMVERLHSRLLLWCRHGTGSIQVDGARLTLPPGHFVLLPWGCSIRYQAARRLPFLLGGVHLIPHCDGPWHPGAAHAGADAIAQHRDDPELLPILSHRAWTDHPALAHLAEHLVEAWQAAPPDMATAYAQGHVLWTTLQRSVYQAASMSLPPELVRVIAVVRQRPALPWSLADLATSAGCSTAWLRRLFVRHLRVSPRRYIAALRLERSCALLREHSLSIAAVGAAVGVPDQARFAKVFRAAYGMPPGRWRSAQRGV